MNGNSEVEGPLTERRVHFSEDPPTRKVLFLVCISLHITFTFVNVTTSPFQDL